MLGERLWHFSHTSVHFMITKMTYCWLLYSFNLPKTWKFNFHIKICFTATFMGIIFHRKSIFLRPVLSYSAVTTATWQHYSWTLEAVGGKVGTVWPASSSSSSIFVSLNRILHQLYKLPCKFNDPALNGWWGGEGRGGGVDVYLTYYKYFNWNNS